MTTILRVGSLQGVAMSDLVVWTHSFEYMGALYPVALTVIVLCVQYESMALIMQNPKSV